MTPQPNHRSPTRWARFLSRLRHDQRGTVLIIMGFALIPLTLAVGFGIDYARATRLRTQLNAAADAAALAAVAPTMILQSDTAAFAAATNMFNAQAALLTGYQGLKMTPIITASTSSGNSGALGYLRKATISYTVQSINLFGGVLGFKTLNVAGTSSASAQQPPNVDFYLAMDNSPSMLLPATSDGISKVQAVTGCAFACHEQMPHNDGIYVKTGSGLHVLLSSGYYTSGSSKQGVYYLYDSGAGKLYDSSASDMGTSTTKSTDGSTTYSGSGYSRTSSYKTTTTLTNTSYSISDSSSGPVTITQTTTTTSSSTTTTTWTAFNYSSTSSPQSGPSSTSSSTYDTGYWADGYWLTHNYGKLFGNPSSLILRKDDVVSAASQLIPFAANQAAQFNVTYRAQMFAFDWTRSGNSTPVNTLNNLTNVTAYGSNFSAATLFPADDTWWQNSQPTSSTNNNDQSSELSNTLVAMKNLIPTAGTGAAGASPQKVLFVVTDGMLDQPNNGSRYFGPLQSSDIAQCTAIKAKGIKVAILYTQYLPEALSGDSWSQANIAPFLPAPPSPYSTGNAGSSDQVLAALQKCASPGIDGSPLVQTVTTSSNIATALQQLFSTALQTARLIQ